MNIVAFAPQPKIIIDLVDGTLEGPVRLMTAFGFPLLQSPVGPDDPEAGPRTWQQIAARARGYGVRPGDWITLRVGNRGQCTYRFGSMQTTKQVEIERAA